MGTSYLKLDIIKKWCIRILEENGYTQIKCVQDLNGIDRVIIGKKE